MTSYSTKSTIFKNAITSIFHTSQLSILVFSKLTQLYHVSLREEKVQKRAKNKSARFIKGEINQSGTKRAIEVYGEKEKESKKWEASEGKMVCL